MKKSQNMPQENYFVPAFLHILLRRLVKGTPKLQILTPAREDYNKI
jgi:hypothetical protein